MHSIPFLKSVALESNVKLLEIEPGEELGPPLVAAMTDHFTFDLSKF